MSGKGERTTMRLAHLIARRGLASRRAAEKLIAEGKVTVAGEVVLDPATPVSREAVDIMVDGLTLPEEGPHLYIAINKPPGFLSSFQKSRETGRLLGELINEERRLFTVGRLDRNSSGLLLLTTDGDWANRVMHPRYEKEKEYLARFKGAGPAAAAKRMKRASFEEQGRRFTVKKVRAEPPGVRIVLIEGRNRQIHRLAKSAGLKVLDLVRVRIGPVMLGRLKEGTWRKLKDGEVSELMDEPSGRKQK